MSEVLAIAAIDKDAHLWERDDLDWYVEPEESTDALLTVERFVGRVLDPCCGGGNIVRALRRAGVEVYGTDIVRRTDDKDILLGERDFLTNPPAFPPPNFVMNPPFFRAKGAEAFIRQALSLASGKVCAFVDVKFLAGAQRANGLFTEHPPSRVWILTPRPSCPPGAYLAAGNKAGGGTADWCWLVWDLTSPAGPTQLGWLRRAAA